MRIAFVSANREHLPDAVIPLGLLSVMAAVPDRHDKRLVDLCFEPDPQDALAAQLREAPPGLVALGLRNLWSNDYRGVGDNLRYYGDLMRVIRGATPAPVVLGGGAFSLTPEQLMRHLRPDYGIAGEGEVPLPMLVAALDAGADDLAAVPNLYRCDGDAVVRSGPAEAFVDMDTLPVVDRRVLDARYYTDFGIDSVQTKRGCSLRCDYCAYPRIEGRTSRRRDPAAVAGELLAVREQRPDSKHVFIVDSVFNLPPDHAKAVCRALIARPPCLPWTCYANPLRFDDELAGLMVEAGCAGVEVGSDSGCDDILLRLRKGFGTSRIRALHACARRVGLKDCHSFILGTHGETLDHVARTLDFIAELDPFAVVIGCWVDDAESFDPALRAERQRFRDDIYSLLRERRGAFPRWIVPALRWHFDRRLFAALRHSGLSGPLWQHIDRL